MSVRGLGALHRWTSADGQEFVLGDVTVSPQIVIRELDGRHSKPDSEDNRDSRVGAIGEIPRLSVLRGKTESWQGTIIADSQVELAAARDAFVNAFADPREGTMEIAAHPSYPDGPFAFNARCLTADCPDVLGFGQGGANDSRPWARDFVLTLRLSDPRYYEQYDRAASVTIATPAEGLVLPARLPAPITAPVAGAGEVSLDAGWAPADPVIEFTGPNTGPILVNDSIGQQLSFPGLSVRAGQTVVVDFAERTLELDGQSVRDQLDWTRSGWFDANVNGLKRGVNSLRYLGFSVGAGASMTVRWRKASFG